MKHRACQSKIPRFYPISAERRIYRQRHMAPGTVSILPHLCLDELSFFTIDPPEVNCARFQELLESSWQGKCLLGADASKSSTCTAIVVVFPACELRETWLLHEHCSVFGAEALGIKRALQISSSFDNPTVILSDSKSVIQAVGNVNFSSPAIIIDLVAEISLHPKAVEIAWIPGHVGIQINEAADKAARKDNPSGSWRQLLMARDLIRATRDIINTYIDSWPTSLRQKGRDHLWPFVPWPYSYVSSRYAETLLAHLRTDTAPLNGFLFSRGLCVSPDCPNCGAPETSRHFWITCPKCKEARQDLSSILSIDLTLVQTFTPIYWAHVDLPPCQHLEALERFIYRSNRFV
ncbi:uncharacterized protein [Centruroides vittatus]|uniref:uncharacterized protein n=1 Tax=Centruroides vittatus TaxID=120091 RepID=UPI00350EC908